MELAVETDRGGCLGDSACVIKPWQSMMTGRYHREQEKQGIPPETQACPQELSTGEQERG